MCLSLVIATALPAKNGLYVYEKNLKKIFCPKKISITKKLGGFLDVNLATDKDSYNKLLDNET